MATTVKYLIERLAEFPGDMEVKCILSGDECPHEEGDVLNLGLIGLHPRVGVSIYVGQWADADAGF